MPLNSSSINQFRCCFVITHKVWPLYRITHMPTRIPLRFPLHTLTVLFFLAFAGFALNCASAQNKTTPGSPAPAVVCSASDFKALAYTTNDAQQREDRAKEWLSKYGKSCQLDQLELILMNQAVWLGTANTPPIISAIETIYKQKKASSEELEKAVDKPRGSAANKK